MLPIHYDYRLVALSVFIAACAAYAALSLAERVTAVSGRFKPLWIGGGAFAMGSAIWSMHYIGMLAFQLPVPVHYDVPLVLLSLLAAILSSALALFFTSREKVHPKQLTIAMLAMGGGIATMHYIGMAAMRMRCICTYNWRIVTLSVIIAIVVSGVALASFRYNGILAGWHRFAAAVLMGVAISSMHYTGMAAAHFWRANRSVHLSDTIDVSWLGGIGIAAGTLLLLAIAIIGTIADKYFSAQSLRLQSTEERYRVLFERSLAGIYRGRLDGTVIDMNDACVELLGYKSREEVLGKIIRHIHLGEEDRQSYADLLTRTKRLPARETELYRTDGSTVWVMHSATVIEFADGNPPEIQGTILAIDQLKRTEEQLRSAKHAAESASHAKSQFLANMSHELRTPLNGILSMTELLMEDNLSSEQKEYVELIKNSAENLFSSINHVLEFSTTGATPAREQKEFDLRELIDAEIVSASRLAHKKNLKLGFEVAAEVPDRFWGEPYWIRQIVASLVSNALKFTTHGEVYVQVESRGNSGPNHTVNISVRDTGIGIGADTRAAIFEPFYQADSSDTRQFGGVGLGLSIVRNLVQAMGGQISVESQPGKGSTFSVVLPLVVQGDRIHAAHLAGQPSTLETWPEPALHI